MRSLLGRNSRWFQLFVAALLATVVFAVAPCLAADQKIRLNPGESQIIKLDFSIVKVATGSSDVCGVTVTGDGEVLINATGVGETNILIWGSAGLQKELAVTVVQRDATGLARELKQLFEDIEGVNVRVVGQSVAVEGEVFRRKDLDRVNLVLEGVPGAINLVKMSSMMREILSSEMEKAIGLKGVKVRNAKDSFILEGIADSENEIIRAEKIAQAYDSNIVNVIQLKQAPGNAGAGKMVQMTLNIMEIEKSALKDLGFHWNPGAVGTATGAVQDGNFTSVVTGTIANLFPKMKFIKENGKGRSLYQQTVVTKSGSKAEFFVGDEIPIPVAQQGGLMSVEYKKVGLTLNFMPVIDVAGSIDVLVEVDSSFVTGQGMGGAPKISDTKLNSAVYLKDAESITLGGLIGQREARTLSNSPPGGGAAFVQLNDSSRFQHDKSQVLVFVTPQILARSSDAVKKMGGEIQESFKQYERENLQPAGKKGAE